MPGTPARLRVRPAQRGFQPTGCRPRPVAAKTNAVRGDADGPQNVAGSSPAQLTASLSGRGPRLKVAGPRPPSCVAVEVAEQGVGYCGWGTVSETVRWPKVPAFGGVCASAAPAGTVARAGRLEAHDSGRMAGKIIDGYRAELDDRSGNLQRIAKRLGPERLAELPSSSVPKVVCGAWARVSPEALLAHGLDQPLEKSAGRRSGTSGSQTPAWIPLRRSPVRVRLAPSLFMRNPALRYFSGAV